jgi:hypothetical protein
MATTTNYGWTTPNDTDLVKDGAAAIRTLGSSIDTTTKALNPSTTLGDIEYRSATANTNTRLGIGTTGQVLSVSGGVPAWTTPTAAASGLTLIAAGTITSAATFNFGTVFSSTYDNYLVQLEGRAGSGRPQLSAFMRASGTNNTSANYFAAAAGRNYNNTAIGWSDASSASFNLGLVPGGDRYTLSLTVVNPNLALNTMLTGTMVAVAPGQTDFGYVTWGGHYLANNVFDSMGFSMASSDFTGRYKVYGLAN